MSELYNVLKADVEKLVADFHKANEDNLLTLGEIWLLVQDGLTTFANAANKLQGTEVERKTAIMEASGQFYDEILAGLIAQSVSGPFGGIIAKFGKNVYMELVSGSVDYIQKTLHKQEEKKV